MKKDFLSIEDIKREEMFELFKLTERIKKKPFNNLLKNKMFCLFFEKPSTRTKVSFHVGIKQMGGESYSLDSSTSQMSRGESVEDTVRTIERYTNAGIIARVYSHKTLRTMSGITGLHVINALSDLEHPCQTLADLFTIKEKFKDFKKLKVAFIGDGNNVCNSLLLGCAKVGININIASPKEYTPPREIIETAINYSKITKCDINIMKDPRKAVKGANVVYTDTFVSMGEEKEREKRLEAFLPKFQVDERLMDHSGSDALFMHCLPAHREEEVTGDVIDGHRSIVFDQAENRLHVQKALLVNLLGLEMWIR